VPSGEMTRKNDASVEGDVANDKPFG
jgi:hypothetical protein